MWHSSLSRNRLGDEAVCAIAHAIGGNTALCESMTALDLEGNQLRDEGARALDRMASSMRRLTKLQLMGNPLTATAARQIAASAKGRRQPAAEGQSAATTAAAGHPGPATPMSFTSMSRLSDRQIEWCSRALQPVDAVLIASDLAISLRLASLDLSNNCICGLTRHEASSGRRRAAWAASATSPAAAPMAASSPSAAVAARSAQAKVRPAPTAALSPPGSGAKLKASPAFHSRPTTIEGTFQAEGIQALAEALTENRTLTSLSLASNQIGGALARTAHAAAPPSTRYLTPPPGHLAAFARPRRS